jgi:hypothetical protein
MGYDTQSYWGSRLCPSPEIKKQKHDISETSHFRNVAYYFVNPRQWTESRTSIILSKYVQFK